MHIYKQDFSLKHLLYTIIIICCVSASLLHVTLSQFKSAISCSFFFFFERGWTLPFLFYPGGNKKCVNIVVWNSKARNTLTTYRKSAWGKSWAQNGYWLLQQFFSSSRVKGQSFDKMSSAFFLLPCYYYTLPQRDSKVHSRPEPF